MGGGSQKPREAATHLGSCLFSFRCGASSTLRLVWPRRSRDGSCLGRGPAAAASTAASSSASPVSAAAAAAVLGTGQATQQQRRWQQRCRGPRNSRAGDGESRSKRRHRQKNVSEAEHKLSLYHPRARRLAHTLPASRLVAAPIRAPNERDQRQLGSKKKKKKEKKTPPPTEGGTFFFTYPSAPLPPLSPPPRTSEALLANALRSGSQAGKTHLRKARRERLRSR